MNRRALFFDPDPPNPAGGGGAPPAPTPPSPPPTPPAAPAPNQPTGFYDGKYIDQGAFERAHREAEQTIGRLNAELAAFKKQQPTPTATPPATPAGPDGGLTIPTTPAAPDPKATPPGQIDIKTILTEAKLEAPALVKQWNDKGALTDDQYKAFETRGISRNTVNDYMRGQQAIHALSVQTQKEIKTGAIAKLGGGQVGEQRVSTLLKFAATLDKPRQDDIQRRLHDPNLYHGAIDELASEYNRQHNLSGSNAIVVGTGPRIAGGGGDGAKPFNSQWELANAAKAARAKHGGRENSHFDDPEFMARLYTTDTSKLR